MIREELILQYLNNETSVSDAKLVEEWAVENPLDFKLSKEIWEHSSHAKEIKIFDVDQEWSAFMQNLENSEILLEEENTKENSEITPIVPEAKVVQMSRWNEWRPVVATAAMFILVAAAYFLWPRNQELTLVATADNNEVILSDKTLVTLEPGSSITYLKSFKGEEKRIVMLDGIATFDITPNPDQPFIVETFNSGVKALGTIFIVDASQEGQTGVENVEGLIRFFDVVEESKFKDVKEGESFVYDGNDFVETTPVEPIIRRFPAVTPPAPQYTIRQVVNRLYTISNGHAVPRGDDFDWNKKITIDLDTYDVKKLLRELDQKTNIKVFKKGCDDCYEIVKIRVRR